jgi:formylglycine-generating enzyme required for sulfatase activity
MQELWGEDFDNRCLARTIRAEPGEYRVAIQQLTPRLLSAPRSWIFSRVSSRTAAWSLHTRRKQIKEWMKRHSDSLSPLEKEFLEASQKAISRERLRWVGVTFAGIGLLVMVVLGISGQLNRFIYRPVDMENYWVTVPAGEFLMGSSPQDIQYAQSLCSDCDFSDEQPQHSVFLDEYQIGKYEVTNRQYSQCVKANICSGRSSSVANLALRPVVNLTWYDAKAYCEWVGARLPTEAEWEKAASWDDMTKTKHTYPGGESIDCTYASYFPKYGACVGETQSPRSDTATVGNYERGKSPYGIYDMAGNAAEWLNDWYGVDYYASSPASNPLGPEKGISKVVRGGSWYDQDSAARSARRSRIFPTGTYTFDIGFRCSRSP